MKSRNKDNGYKFICIQTPDGPQIVSYKLERSSRLKRMRIQIDSPEYVTLKMPMRMAEKHGTRFLQEHGEWISEALAEQPGVVTLQSYLQKQSRISLSGRRYRAVISFHDKRSNYRVDDTEKLVSFLVNSFQPVEPQLRTLLIGLAREYLPERVRYWAGELGLKPHGVTIRDQKSRWGSCSETGGISLNWRLILVAPKLQDYVILHELAHIRHFDHSSDFHATLELYDPKASQHASQLHNEAAGVFALGRSRE